MKWLKEEIEKAIKLNRNGKRFEEIAIELNRDTRSIQVKLNKLGYRENKINTTEELICIECNKEFVGKRKDNRKFCSQSCGAKFNNKKYPKRKSNTKEKYCLNCYIELNYQQNRFCSHDCSITYRWNERVKKIENGDTSFTSNTYKKYLIYKFGNKCMKCGWNEINSVTGLVPIQLEHKDGNSENHDLKNLKLLCPNCHSLTPTFGALNKGNGRTKRREKRQQKMKM